MQNTSPEFLSRLVVTHFLAHLMKTEREKLGLSTKLAAKDAEWSTRIWEDLEAETNPVEPIHWRTAVQVLGLGPKDVVLKLDAFVDEHPSVWFERTADSDYRVCERPVEGAIYNRELIM